MENREEDDDDLNFNKRETATMKQIRKLMKSQQQQPDWNRIKNDQSQYLLMQVLQNIFLLWLLLLLYLMKVGQQIADYVKYPVDLLLLFFYLFTLVTIQYKEEEWRIPPFNFILYLTHFGSRILLIIFVIFKYTFIHLEIVFIMMTIDYVIVFICFQFDKKHKNQCFLAKDYWWRAIIIFMLQEILVNLKYDVYTWFEVFTWFMSFFFILCFVLWECQMVRFRSFLSFYFNSFYLGQLYFESDILFPCQILMIYKS